MASTTKRHPAEFSGPQAAFVDYFRATGLSYKFEQPLRQAFMAGAVWAIARQQFNGEKIQRTAMRYLPPAPGASDD